MPGPAFQQSGVEYEAFCSHKKTAHGKGEEPCAVLNRKKEKPVYQGVVIVLDHPVGECSKKVSGIFSCSVGIKKQRTGKEEEKPVRCLGGS